MELISNIIIPITGALAIFLSQDKRDHIARWASVVGLLGQPFWFYIAYITNQWGVFFSCFLFLFAWLKGFYNYWIVK